MLFRASFGNLRLCRNFLVYAILPAFLFSANIAVAINGEMKDGGRYMEKLGVCSFKPPEGWVLWDYYGLDVFSPTENKDIRLSLIAVESARDDLAPETSNEETATDSNDTSTPFLKKKVKGFENTFSEPDFEILTLEEKEIGGHPGVEVCARATTENQLFPDTIIRIVQYYTPTHIVTMTLRCPMAALDEYTDIIITAIESIAINLPPEGDVSFP